MKIIDETGAVMENPDLALGYLTDDTQPLEHPAQEAVAEVAHYETVAEYPSGGRDVQRVAYRQGPRGPSSCPLKGISATPPRSCPRRKKRARSRKQRTSCRTRWPT